MRRIILAAAPLLLTACTASWPAMPYVRLAAEADAAVLAPAVSACVGELVPPGTAISLSPPPPADVLSPILTDSLTRGGMTPRSGGLAISYIAAPVGQGQFVRVVAAPPGGICSQYFARDAAGALTLDGPMMVARR